MGRAVRHFEREVSFKLGKGVENVTSNCMGRAVRQFEKEVSFRLETGAGYMLHQTVWDAPSASSIKKVSFKLGKGVEMLHRSIWDVPSASSIKKLVLN